VLGNKDLMPVFLRKHLAGIEFHAQGRDMRPQRDGGWIKILAGSLFAELWIWSLSQSKTA
jgi:hypothetical protein